MQKKRKEWKKLQKWLRRENEKYCDIIKLCRDKNPKAICRSLSQQAELYCNKDKAKCRMTVERMSRHFTALSRHRIR